MSYTQEPDDMDDNTEDVSQEGEDWTASREATLHSLCKVLLDTLTVTQLIRKSPAFH
jgi:hypothetical protein